MRGVHGNMSPILNCDENLTDLAGFDTDLEGQKIVPGQAFVDWSGQQFLGMKAGNRRYGPAGDRHLPPLAAQAMNGFAALEEMPRRKVAEQQQRARLGQGDLSFDEGAADLDFRR